MVSRGVQQPRPPPPALQSPPRIRACATAAASVGYFLAPLFTKYSLGEFGWQETLRFFLYFIFFGSIVALFIVPAKNIPSKMGDDNQQKFFDLDVFQEYLLRFQDHQSMQDLF